MKLESVKAIVTGGASGLGRAVVEAVNACGARAVILDVDQDAGLALAGSLGERITYLAADVTSDASVDDAVSRAAEQLDGIAALTLALAREFARFGIRIVAVAPGVFETPLAAGLPEKARAALSETQVFP